VTTAPSATRRAASPRPATFSIENRTRE
jgi:hypothetical protein